MGAADPDTAAAMPRRLRVLHFAQVINRGDIIDAALCRIDRSRFDVAALVGQPARRVGSYPPGIPYEVKVLNVNLTYGSLPRAFLSLLAEVRRFRPHVLHAHHFSENLLATALTFLRGRLRYVIGRHYSDHIYFLTHGLKRQVFLGAEAVCNRRADRILVPTQEVASLLIDRQGVPHSKVTIIPYALDLGLLRPSTPDAGDRLRARYGLGQSRVLLAACRLNPEKGLEYLMRAMPRILERHPPSRLVLVGSGPSEDGLRRLAGTLGVGHEVLFLGWSDAVLDWMAAADIVVQPSLCESYGQVLVEALALGRPVVMTPVGIAPEVLSGGRGGALVPKADSEAIASAVGALLTRVDRGRGLAEDGFRWVATQMNPDAVARRYEDLYASVVADRERVAGNSGELA